MLPPSLLGFIARKSTQECLSNEAQKQRIRQYYDCLGEIGYSVSSSQRKSSTLRGCVSSCDQPFSAGDSLGGHAFCVTTPRLSYWVMAEVRRGLKVFGVSRGIVR